MVFQPKISPLSLKGEVLEAPDDDQFGSFESLMKCGYEIVALFWHSTAPGTKNTYTAADVHRMAHEDYIHFVGPDVPSDPGGMSTQQLYQDLSSHGFSFLPCPLQWDVIHAWVRLGYPVILGVQEDSVYDLDPAIRGRPYAWPPNGLSHIILCTGVDRFRDTATIGPQGVRPGPRQYDETKLQMVSATMVVPSWLFKQYGMMPPAHFDPRSAMPGPPAPPPDPFQQERAVWTSLEPIPFNPAFAIEASWIRIFRSGCFLGVPITREFENAGFTWQVFTGALARWSKETGVIWFGLHGHFPG